jgi:hypothetical protein
VTVPLDRHGSSKPSGSAVAAALRQLLVTAEAKLQEALPEQRVPESAVVNR